MSKRSTLLFLLTLIVAPAMHAQDPVPPTRLQRLLTHFDVGVAGTALFTSGVTGTVQNSTATTQASVTQTASIAAGVLVTIRGQKSPYRGFEINYGYGKATQSYTCCNYTTSGVYIGPFLSQATQAEYTVGYLARPPHPIFGLQPYIGGGAGTIQFKPTRTGGQNVLTQARMTYYYTVGVEAPLLGNYLGLRAGFRQLIYLAPDFGQNYLTIKKRTFTSEPQVGIYLHF